MMNRWRCWPWPIRPPSHPSTVDTFRKILAFAARRLPTRADAEDLAADVMRKAHSSRESFRGGS